jgi:hypothetical protein
MRVATMALSKPTKPDLEGENVIGAGNQHLDGSDDELGSSAGPGRLAHTYPISPRLGAELGARCAETSSEEISDSNT